MKERKGKYEISNFIRTKKKKTPHSGSTKTHSKNQEMGRQDLKKFLKRVSTPLGTKSKASAVISSHDFNRIITKKEVRFLLFSNSA